MKAFCGGDHIVTTNTSQKHDTDHTQTTYVL